MTVSRTPLPRWVLFLAVCALIVTVVAADVGHRAARELVVGADGLRTLPASVLGAISTQVGADDPAYAATQRDGAWMLSAGGGLHASFSAGGTRIAVGGGTVTLSPESLRSDARLSLVRGGQIRGAHNRVTVTTGVLDTSFASGPLGLEQGFIVPHGSARGPVTITQSVGGATVDATRDTVTLRGVRGQVLLTADGLRVTDRSGRRLPAWFAGSRDHLAIVIDARRAVYPVTIDPVLRSPALTARDADQGFGGSVAITPDLIAVGAPQADIGSAADEGAVYVFTRPAGGWSGELRRAAELIPRTHATGGELGTAVAALGGTVVAGAPGTKIGAHFGAGAVYVFTAPAGGWHGTVRSTAQLHAPRPQAASGLGSSVASTGRLVVAGAPQATVDGDESRGAVFAFQRPRDGWGSGTPAGAQLIAGNGQEDDVLGTRVAISGGDVVASAPGDDACEGSTLGYVDVFRAPTRGWRGTHTQTARLRGAGSMVGIGLGADGDTIVAGTGIPCNKYGTSGVPTSGQLLVFAKPAQGWHTTTTSTAVLDPIGNGGFGTGLVVSGDTILAFSGANAVAPYSSASGYLYEFTRPVQGWATTTTPTATLPVTPVAPGGGLGTDLAISGDTLLWGTTLLAPGPAGWAAAHRVGALLVPTGPGYAEHGFGAIAASRAYAFATDSQPGAAVDVFRRAGSRWVNATQIATLTLPTTTTYTSIAATGSTVVVGVEAQPPATVGAAYVYDEPATGWRGTINPAARLVPSDGTTGSCALPPRLNGGGGSQFGLSVAATADAIFVGSPCAADGPGAVYVFDRPAGGWHGARTENAQLTAAGEPGETQLGFSLALAGQTVVAGDAPVFSSGHGAVYLFNRPASGWQSTAKPNATLTVPARGSPPELSSLIGDTVAAGGNTVLIPVGGREGGAVIDLYERPAGGWSGTRSPTARLTEPAGAASANGLAPTFAVSGHVVAAATLDEQSPAASPRLDAFRMPVGGWRGTVYPTAQVPLGPVGDELDGLALDGTTALLSDNAEVIPIALPPIRKS